MRKIKITCGMALIASVLLNIVLIVALLLSVSVDCYQPEANIQHQSSEEFPLTVQ